MDSINDAREYGIDSVASLAFDKNGVGVTEAIASLSERVTDYRTSPAKVFSLAEKTWKSRAQSRNEKVNNLLFE